MQKAILRAFEYFNIFFYPISFEELYQYLGIKISKKRLKLELKQLITKKAVFYRHGLYTLGEYSKGKLEIPASRGERNSKFEISQEKLNNWRFRAYLKLISLFPQIKLVGLSGSISMMNAKENDDIDLFIITAKNRLFTGRFIAMVLAQLTGLRRRRQLAKLDTVSNKVCLNLFFDETKLNIPKFKKNYYIAHEIIQMKPLINKNNVYELFLYSNRWVCDIFPNSRPQRHPHDPQRHPHEDGDPEHGFPIRSGMTPQLSSPSSQLSSPWKRGSSRASDFIELILKKIQLSVINRHKTNELITNKQLWFFPDDFENRLPKFARKKYNA